MTLISFPHIYRGGGDGWIGEWKGGTSCVSGVREGREGSRTDWWHSVCEAMRH